MNGWNVQLNNRNQITGGTSFSIGTRCAHSHIIRWKKNMFEECAKIGRALEAWLLHKSPPSCSKSICTNAWFLRESDQKAFATSIAYVILQFAYIVVSVQWILLLLLCKQTANWNTLLNNWKTLLNETNPSAWKKMVEHRQKLQINMMYSFNLIRLNWRANKNDFIIITIAIASKNNLFKELIWLTILGVQSIFSATIFSNWIGFP